ncbi:nuclease-related domain-containing protein [Algoriphagus yeomjeoni]|uniref:NERD domain-containing protein n=1 Tax=Algoriphagus yeomjeoni TaxID=291403 RepID=A0A327PDY9_9BACT|nr:nuclease-related domain-containing protein [Algoriphagus yeomjeoni]RAI88066.1 hypothetical protein LV83_02984 [Algoriphagus yeomjeoni]
MFDNTSNIFLSNYEVQLDNIVGAICDISYDIGKQLEEIIEIHSKEKGFTIIDLFTESFIKEISNIRLESLTGQTTEDVTTTGYTIQEFFSIIADHFNKALFYDNEFLKALKGSDILLVDKEATTFLGIGEKAKDRLIPALKSAKILKKLISNLKSDKIQRSLQKIDTFENDIFYKNTIKASKLEGQPLLPYLKLSIINETSVHHNIVDRGNYWINDTAYLTLGVDLTGDVEYSVLTDIENDRIIGLVIKGILIPYANVDLVKYIKTEQLYNYYWTLFEYSYCTKSTTLKTATDQMLEEFKALTTDAELNQLLSHLKNNFYIKDKEKINKKFVKFFNDVVILEKLDFLTNYSFLMSSNYQDETALGVYSNERPEKSYNLLHWLNHNGETKINHFRSHAPNEIKKTIIHTLKPAICYYFLEKYFEDLFQKLLENNNYTFLANQKLYEKGQQFCEIDFLVRTEKKFYYIETKTKLSKFYIDDFLKKTSKMIKKFRPMTDNSIEIEYFLIGGYSDNNVDEYQYFITNNGKNTDEIYNVPRPNLNTKPYFFTVPVPDQEGKQITCIAEPEYNNLQNLFLSLCVK